MSAGSEKPLQTAQLEAAEGSSHVFESKVLRSSETPSDSGVQVPYIGVRLGSSWPHGNPMPVICNQTSFSALYHERVSLNPSSGVIAACQSSTRFARSGEHVHDFCVISIALSREKSPPRPV